jgi:hypothetical protein
MNEATNPMFPSIPQGPPHVHPDYIPPPQMAMFQNLIPHQEVINTQLDVASHEHQQGQFPPLEKSHPSNTTDRTILLTTEE